MSSNSSHQNPPICLAELQAELGQDCVSVGANLHERYAADWSEAPPQRPAIVLKPRSPAQVAQALAICHRHDQAVVIQGGLTGLAGGATPQAEEVVLSLERLNEIEDFDTTGGLIQVQAGITLQALQQHVEAAGWQFPLDLGARGSCQIGGNAATNAGGNRVIRYGTMRRLILGLEVALPDGRLLNLLGRVTKDTTGVDLKQLFIGAEGTLGVITRLVLRLSPLCANSSVALCALPSFQAATRLVQELRRALPELSAFELMWQGFLTASCEVAGLRPPFTEAAPLYALIETQGNHAETDRERLESALAQALESGWATDAIVAQSLTENTSLWAYRESVGELLGRLKPFAAFDVAIPMSRMDDFVAQADALMQARYPTTRHLFFGHLGDDNLHLLTGPYSDTTKLHTVESLIYELVADFKGSISGEHGIGVVKKPFLPHSRSPEELEIMRQLKALFDPKDILNRGRIL